MIGRSTAGGLEDVEDGFRFGDRWERLGFVCARGSTIEVIDSKTEELKRIEIEGVPGEVVIMEETSIEGAGGVGIRIEGTTIEPEDRTS